MPHVPEAIQETERGATLPGFAGVQITTHIQSVPIDDPRWHPLYATWDRMGLAVLVHPDGFCVPHLFDDYGLELGIGAPFDDTIAAIRLIHSGVMERFANVRWIVPQLGGTLPFLLGRLDAQWNRLRDLVPLSPSEPSRSLTNLYFDTVCPDAPSLRFASEQLGVDRLVLGSDFPNVSKDDLGLGPALLTEAGFSDVERRAVLVENPSRLLWSPLA